MRTLNFKIQETICFFHGVNRNLIIFTVAANELRQTEIYKVDRNPPIIAYELHLLSLLDSPLFSETSATVIDGSV